MKSKGFTLLELLLVVSLLLLVFGTVGYTFISNIRGSAELSYLTERYISYISVKNQLAKQMFSKVEKRKENFILGNGGISFYTVYPLFFTGAVRAEYRVEKEGQKSKLFYMEYPYMDGRLGSDGIKKVLLGVFDDIEFEAYYKGRFLQHYRGKNFPSIIRLKIDGKSFYIPAGSEL
ncbi:prepilin-type N-terminal cleavage/methylation domain-containing protein [Persephonella hydrogeniphila]|uniref:Prepilin-type N-terminal cleavage/methylation domain-containing protein n=1 Tax=Persephonella hydrogeniphila TaxID=198703 RepID=A0A285NAZ0_9AQUI|nr:prepilin-type N-terminal cleavage/methylation domain-containing protein [Persephonella hydrogeniphila]SNZ06478.1 prepilin-type N-terminal cleavage/methylation domain-containing protein [Persephonella hydrogeniphila]